MVDLAMKGLPDDILFDAITETQTCLPDAVQLLTPCTIGNGWLKIIDYGRYALCLYDKYQGNGIRVYIDTEKLEQWPEIKDWFFKLKPKKEQDPIILRDRIIDAGTDILSVQQVTVAEAFMGKVGKGAIAVCPSCNEAYPSRDGASCLACQEGDAYTSVHDDVTKPRLAVIAVKTPHNE